MALPGPSINYLELLPTCLFEEEIGIKLIKSKLTFCVNEAISCQLYHQLIGEMSMLYGQYPVCIRQMQESDFIMKIKF